MVTKTPKQIDHLLPERYPIPDLFVCDVSDAVLKDVMSEMEHPFYALSKKPDTTTRRYEHNAQWIEITPSGEGQATIYDKDILIYCISQIMAKLNRNEPVSKRVRINSHELLMFCNRGTAGKDYAALSGALTRLAGTVIKTNIRVSEDEEDIEVFSLIDKATIRRKMGLDGRLQWCDVTLSDWVFDAIRANDVLTLHRDYFRLRKPLERRMYELARKHCGQQDQWSPYLSLLHKKSGSKSPLKRFKQLVKHIAEHDLLPDYHVLFDTEQDKVTFLNRGTMPIEKNKIWNGQLSPDVFEKIEKMKIGTDKYYLENQFRSWIAKQGIMPKNPDGMFLSFCKTIKKKHSQGQLF
jgi:plasmid replication initiation protein